MEGDSNLDPMAPRRRGFLIRLGNWLRPWKRGDDVSDEMLYPGDAEETSAGSEMSWPRRRTSQISRLEEGFDKLIHLVDTIDQHIKSQADRSEQLTGQMRRVADAVGQSQGLDRQRTEAVEEMANQFKNQARQMQQVAEAVESLPRTIKGQSEHLQQIRDQLEAQLEAQLSTAQGIQQLAGAAEGMRAAADVQRSHFEKLHDANHATQMQVVGALERQSRRFTWLMAFTLGLTLTAAAAAVVAIVLAVRA